VKHTIGGLALTVLLGAGCAAFGPEKTFFNDEQFRKAYYEQHRAELSEDQQRAVLQAEIIPGMEMKTVQDLLGAPNEKYRSPTGLMEVWRYPKWYVGFGDDGKVVRFDFYPTRR